MDAASTPKKSDWIGEGRAWASVPPAVRKIAAEYFLIPQELEQNLLPSPYLSIAKMCQFSLPLQDTSPPPTQPAQFFSTSAPDHISDEDLMVRLRRLPIPDSKTVHKLAACSRQAWFPLWILTYWVAIIALKRDAWGHWRTCQQWVQRQKKLTTKNPARAVLAEEAALMLTMLPWGVPKPLGLSDTEAVHTFWRFLGPHWLSGSQMNDMLELLRRKINSDASLINNFRVAGTAFIPKVLEAYRAAEAGEYWTSPDLRWVRDLGDDIVQSSAALITTGHLGEVTDEPHWVGVVFDCRGSTLLRYGDSQGDTQRMLGSGISLSATKRTVSPAGCWWGTRSSILWILPYLWTHLSMSPMHASRSSPRWLHRSCIVAGDREEHGACRR
ncbi:hypothetical protein B0H16DRAFT_1529681 [Mycena metata]|uniref:Ubiquitin-like protease family profile domain-containing protein n=1 Tax=Mycena metata TaxID=1033252 RepID=A0AAD7MZR7_9AGAR|nr:hypothetical protein B0H16DRAFT_1568875 [Mycena metata]KAJ7762096.1 hypothetical protein B0H16DRAFT_1529681 [Mycena metata]